MSFASHSSSMQAIFNTPVHGGAKLALPGPAKARFVVQTRRCQRTAQQTTTTRRRLPGICQSSNNEMAPNNFDLSQYRLAEVATVLDWEELFAVCQEQKNGKPQPSWCVLLKMLDTDNCLAVYVGDAEGSSLQLEVSIANSRHKLRPLTYDLMKSSLTALGARVTKVCITHLVEGTYYASVHYARAGHTDEIVMDSRPSDAINLAVRFGAPLYVNKDVAEQMGQKLNLDGIPQPELPADVEVTCRAVLKRYHDPTFLHKINMQVAVQEDRFEDAAKIRNEIERILSCDRTLSLVVALESALSDKRWEEAAFLRDELVDLVDVIPEQRLQDA